MTREQHEKRKQQKNEEHFEKLMFKAKQKEDPQPPDFRGTAKFGYTVEDVDESPSKTQEEADSENKSDNLPQFVPTQEAVTIAPTI